eukprot:CAMPEP_0171473358 /NCGR_PEP_ID=MMETSP0946-20130122/1793_1 /TAXON_ID=109269 /ORGANISM="Vaucheria litorea, Strain CCMP2940" /LENGTH=341 /DNA_ID=CAMNT_0012003105 /DNA_START=248 /DNA_END=1273 /DNA_ORIENTATION=-
MTWGSQNTHQDACEQLDMAFDEFGVNFIDTAEMYPIPIRPEHQGETDVAISRWLKHRNRDDVVLASKITGPGEFVKFIRGGKSPRIRKSDIVESVDNSLKRLGTDYIDLLQIHWPDRYVPLFGSKLYDVNQERKDEISIEEQLLGFEEVIKSGKVRHIGLSNETPYGVMKFVEIAEEMGLPRVCSVQNGYSLLNRHETEQSGLVEVVSKNNANVSFLAYSPLAGGALTGKYLNPDDLPEKSRLVLFGGFMERFLNRSCSKAIGDYVEIANQIGLTSAQLALAWCYKQKFVTSTIIGATSMSQLKENLCAYNCPITEEAAEMIQETYYEFTDPARTWQPKKK